jgi:hypothetical protein
MDAQYTPYISVPAVYAAQYAALRRSLQLLAPVHTGGTSQHPPLLAAYGAPRHLQPQQIMITYY